jgi:hypothetical protein
MNTLQRIILVLGVAGLAIVAWRTPSQRTPDHNSYLPVQHHWLWQQACVQCSIVTLATGGLFLAAWRVKV